MGKEILGNIWLGGGNHIDANLYKVGLTKEMLVVIIISAVFSTVVMNWKWGNHSLWKSTPTDTWDNEKILGFRKIKQSLEGEPRLFFRAMD